MGIELPGTMSGVKPTAVPMPKTFRLENDGYKCPAPPKREPKFKVNGTKVKFLPCQKGDLAIMYDVLQADEGVGVYSARPEKGSIEGAGSALGLGGGTPKPKIEKKTHRAWRFCEELGRL